MKGNLPPKFLLRFFKWFCHPSLHTYLEGDLLELYQERCIKAGKQKAIKRLIIDVLLLFRPSIIRPLEGFAMLNNYGILKNYFKVAIRNMARHKIFTLINVFGLAVAMSVCFLIIMMLVDQGQSDQFHLNKDRIYRVIGNSDDYVLPYASSAVPLPNTLKLESPIIEEAIHLQKGVGGDASYRKRTKEMRGFFTSSAFFKIFSFDLTSGDKNTALSAPNSMVITSTVASYLFHGENPIGKTISFAGRNLDILGTDSNDNPPVDWGLFTVTGVMADSGYKSHLKFDVLVSSSSTNNLINEHKIANLTNNWSNFYSSYTYLLLKEKSKENDLAIALDKISNAKYGDQNQKEELKLGYQRLSEISLGPYMAIPISLRLPVEVYYALIFFATLIMILASLNYVNLTIARITTRLKEIGIRKINGGSRKNIIHQFLSESLLTMMFALGISILLLFFVKSAFMGLWLNKYINFDLQLSPSVYLTFIGFALAISLIIGAYPAIYMSKFNSLLLLKNLQIKNGGKLRLSKIINISQFSASLFFIVTFLTIFNQFNHYLKFEYGFEPNQIVNVRLQSNDYRIVRNEFSKVSGVSAITACSFIPTSGGGEGQFLRNSNSNKKHQLFTIMKATEGFIDNLGIKLLAGRDLSQEGTVADRRVVINEFAVKQLGYQTNSEAIGKVLEYKNGSEPFEIIGVIEDFQFKAIWEKRDAPLILVSEPTKYRHVNIKIESASAMQTIGELEDRWDKIDPVHPFEYEFFDEQLASMNSFLKDIVSIVGFIGFLAIVISCLGLWGMAIYTSERRIKEVAVRKVLGATLAQLNLLLSKSFLYILSISIAISAPACYLFNNLWLENISNRISFGFGTIMVGSALLLFIGLLTIGSQIVSVSRRNPAQILKDE